MTDREFARQHRVTRPPTERPGLWLLAVVAAAPFVLAAARTRWDFDWVFVPWAAILLGLGALLVAMPARWRHRTLLSLLARETADRTALEHELATAHDLARDQRRRLSETAERVDRLEDANGKLGRALDDAITHPCAGCPAAEDVA